MFSEKQKHVVHENVVGGSRKIGFHRVISVSERDMPEIEPGFGSFAAPCTKYLTYTLLLPSSMNSLFL